jgi:hypothetical protein
MREFGMLRFGSEVLQTVVKQAAWPKAALHGIADELEDREMQLAGDLA